MNRNLKEAYDVLRKATPLKADCGKLCGGLCCKGDGDTGMELFCGEEELLSEAENFKITKTGDGRTLLVCDGTCDRNLRPLACRFYPLFPLVREENGKDVLEVIIDPRSKSCPITSSSIRIAGNFYAAVRRAGLYLMRDEKILAQLKDISGFLIRTIQLEDLLKSF